MALTKFYLLAQDGTVFALHSTTDVSVTLPSRPTQFPVQSGKNVSDNIVRGNNKGKLNGVISDIHTTLDASQRKSPSEFIDEFVRRLDNREVFSVLLEDEFEPFDNCVATSVQFSKNSSLGRGSWQVNIEFEQVRVRQAASFVIADRVLLDLKEKSSQTKKAVDKQTQNCVESRLKGFSDEERGTPLLITTEEGVTHFCTIASQTKSEDVRNIALFKADQLVEAAQ